MALRNIGESESCVILTDSVLFKYFFPKETNILQSLNSKTQRKLGELQFFSPTPIFQKWVLVPKGPKCLFQGSTVME